MGLYALVRCLVVNQIKSKLVKPLLIDKLDKAKTYEDFIDVINLIDNGFSSLIKKTNYSLSYFKDIRINLTNYCVLTNKDNLKIEMETNNVMGTFTVTYKDMKGYVHNKNVYIDTKVNVNATEEMLFIDNESFTLIIPYNDTTKFKNTKKVIEIVEDNTIQELI